MNNLIRRPIMKWLVMALPLLAMSLSPAAFARGHGDRHFSHDSGKHHSRHNGHRNQNRHFRHRSYRHNNRHNYRRNYRHGYRHGSRHSNRGAYLVGGLVVGSIITHALTRPQDRYYRDEYRTTRVVTPRRVSQAPVYSENAVSRRLFRDRDGNCFERTHSDAGDELLIELPAQQCAW